MLNFPFSFSVFVLLVYFFFVTTLISTLFTMPCHLYSQVSIRSDPNDVLYLVIILIISFATVDLMHSIESRFRVTHSSPFDLLFRCQFSIAVSCHVSLVGDVIPLPKLWIL